MTRKTERWPKQPIDGYMALYFSPRPLRLDEQDLCEPGMAYPKSEALYRKHHVYGEHRFLIPAQKQAIERYDAPWNRRFCVDKIGNDPTTATYSEKLQFLPCSASNLDLFKEKLLTEPFYLEIVPDGFLLHVKNDTGRFVRIPAQAHSPNCWHGFAHPVVTVESSLGRQTFHTLNEIPWAKIVSAMVW
jgi:hypothetical protein